VILADGNEYVIKPLNRSGLQAKMAKKDYEGRLYRQLFQLVDKNYDVIKAAKPKVSKDSTGYHLWNVWDRETGIFDMTQVIAGSQGTLGFVTDIRFRLVAHRPHSGTLVVFLRTTEGLGELIDKVMLYRPSAFEGFDNYTLMLSFKLFFYFHKTLGWWGTMKLGLQLLPEALKLFRGIPKMVMLVEFDGQTAAEVTHKVRSLHQVLETYGHEALFEDDDSEQKAKKFWIMRRESFNLLRKKVKDKHTAPFIDDLVVPTHKLASFLPELRKIIDKYKLLATIAGHMGDGNFHVIPLMKIEDPKERAKLLPAMKEVNQLILRYGGSLSGEHNDGLIRGPWLRQMYGKEMLGLFKQTKEIFDPTNMFNPHKKADAEWDYSFSHIRESF
jgi:FAD/FMN-containing dehydrogenase